MAESCEKCRTTAGNGRMKVQRLASRGGLCQGLAFPAVWFASSHPFYDIEQSAIQMTDAYNVRDFCARIIGWQIVSDID